MNNPTRIGIVASVAAVVLWLAAPGEQGLQMNAEPGPPVPETHQEFAAYFQPSANMIEGENYRITFDVTPAIYAWPIGTQHYAAREIVMVCPGGDPQQAIEVKFQVPTEWLCAELRLRSIHMVQTNHLGIQDEESAALHGGAHESLPSNAILFGECPDPMPERIPLAVPEPGSVAMLAVGALGLVLLYWASRRRS